MLNSFMDAARFVGGAILVILTMFAYSWMRSAAARSGFGAGGMPRPYRQGGRPPGKPSAGKPKRSDRDDEV